MTGSALFDLERGMRWLPPAFLFLVLALLACTGTTNPGATACPSTDDAGAFEGTLFTLTDAGALTIDYDAGNGGIDLGAVAFADGGGIGHVYEWPCIATYDCEYPRNASITFVSSNGVSDWRIFDMAYGTEAACAPPVVDAGPSETNCCLACGVEESTCGGLCISSYDPCTSPPCTTCG